MKTGIICTIKYYALPDRAQIVAASGQFGAADACSKRRQQYTGSQTDQRYCDQ